jgi:hypothetical protein
MAAKKKASGKSKAKGKARSKGRAKTHQVMKEFKEGKLKSSSGAKVKKRKQAIAIALNEARESGAKIPKQKKKKA